MCYVMHPYNTGLAPSSRMPDSWLADDTPDCGPRTTSMGMLTYSCRPMTTPPVRERRFMGYSQVEPRIILPVSVFFLSTFCPAPPAVGACGCSAPLAQRHDIG